MKAVFRRISLMSLTALQPSWSPYLNDVTLWLLRYARPLYISDFVAPSLTSLSVSLFENSFTFWPPYILDLMTPWLITPCLMPPVLLILCTFYLMLDASCLWSHFSFFAITTSALVINIIKNLSSIFFSLSLFLSFANGFTKSSLSQIFGFLWHFRSSPKFPKSRLWRRVMPLANLSIHLHLISKLLQFINIDTIVVNRWLERHLQFRDMTKLLLKVSDWLWNPFSNHPLTFMLRSHVNSQSAASAIYPFRNCLVMSTFCSSASLQHFLKPVGS